jgi:hypothetical protein
MKLEKMLSQISAPKGMTSVISGIMNDDFSVLPHQKGVGASIKRAKEEVKKHEKQLRECQSDWAYWSILGDISYWRCIKNILEAADIVGEDNLPDIYFKQDGIVVMDAIGKVEKYGEEVLKEAKKHKSLLENKEKP